MPSNDDIWELDIPGWGPSVETIHDPIITRCRTCGAIDVTDLERLPFECGAGELGGRACRGHLEPVPEQDAAQAVYRLGGWSAVVNMYARAPEPDR